MACMVRHAYKHAGAVPPVPGWTGRSFSHQVGAFQLYLGVEHRPSGRTKRRTERFLPVAGAGLAWGPGSVSCHQACWLWRWPSQLGSVL